MEAIQPLNYEARENVPPRDALSDLQERTDRRIGNLHDSNSALLRKVDRLETALRLIVRRGPPAEYEQIAREALNMPDTASATTTPEFPHGAMWGAGETNGDVADPRAVERIGAAHRIGINRDGGLFIESRVHTDVLSHESTLRIRDKLNAALPVGRA